MSGRVAQLGERLCVEVIDGVARLVVALVVRHASRASVDGGFLRSLDLLRTAEESTRWNANLNERTVIGPAIECRWFRGQTFALEVVKEDLLDCVGSRWARVRSVGAVAVVHEPDIVGRAEHVEVQVRVDLRPLRLCEVIHVVRRPE